MFSCFPLPSSFFPLPFAARSACLPRIINHLEDLHLLGLAFDLGGGVLPNLELRSQPFPGGSGGQDLAALGQAGKAGGGVDRVPDGRELRPLQGADVPQEDLAQKINNYFS